MKKSKKIILFVSMVVVLVVAAVLNVTLLTQKADGSTDQNDDNSTVGNFFATSREDRLTTRNYEIAQLNEIIALEGDEYAEARQNAIKQKQAIVDAMELEMLIETLLKAQGFADVLVSIGSSSENVNVIVDKDELTREDTVRIYNVIATETSIETDYVNIIAV